MAFDRTNPADLTALKTEVETDPIGMGYSTVVDQTNQLLKLLNEPANNVGGETTNAELTAEKLLDVIDVAEFSGNQVDQGERDWLNMVFNFSLSGNQSIEQYRATIKSVFPNNGPTNTAIDSLSRALSRAEVLFGAGTFITRDDWIAARSSA